MGITDLLLDLCRVKAAGNRSLKIRVGLIYSGVNDRNERAKAGGHRMGRGNSKFFQGVLNAGRCFALRCCLAAVIIIGLRCGYPAIALQGGKHRVHRAVAGNAAAYDAPAEECHLCPLQDFKIVSRGNLILDLLCIVKRECEQHFIGRKLGDWLDSWLAVPRQPMQCWKPEWPVPWFYFAGRRICLCR